MRKFAVVVVDIEADFVFDIYSSYEEAEYMVEKYHKDNFAGKADHPYSNLQEFQDGLRYIEVSEEEFKLLKKIFEKDL